MFFDGNPLLKKAQFDFSLANEEISITDFSSGLFLPTDRDIRVVANQIFLGEKQSQCNVQLYDGKKMLIQFNGIRGDQWFGKLAFGPELPVAGNFAIQWAFDPIQDLFTFDAETASLTFLDKEMGKVEAHLTKHGKDCFIDKIKWDQYTLKSSLSPEKDNWVIKNLEISRPEMCMKGEGKLYCDLPTSTQNLLIRADIDIKMDFLQPLPMQFKTREPVKIAFSPELGLVISRLDLSANGSHFLLEHGEHLFLSNKTSGHKCTFSFSEEIVNAMIKAQILPEIASNLQIFKHFAGNCDFAFSPEEKKVVGNFENGAGWHSNLQSPLNFEALIKNSLLSIQLNEENQEDGLNIQGKWEHGKLSLEKIAGKLGPIAASLKNAKGILKGTLDLDFSNISSFLNLPLNHWASLWQLGKGFRLDGEFSSHAQLQDWEFKGKVKGKDCVCAGYPLQNFEAKIELQPGQIIIENLDISDEAGKLWINDGMLNRHGNQWMFSFPLIEIRNLQPQVLNHPKTSEKIVSPVMIKTASISDVHGILDKPSSISGQGSLRFSSKEKNKFSFLQKLPLQLLKKMGLDESLITPISGEVDFSIRDGKIFLQALKGVQSDKKRSEFFIPKGGEQTYFDFQGNLFLNIKMRQFVIPALTEPLSLSIRGTWSEPEFSIK